MFFLAISSLSRYLEARSRPSPIAASVVAFRTPKVSRSHVGVEAAMHDFKMETVPKVLKPTQLRPAAPLSPNASCSAVGEPIRAVSAVISINPDPISPLGPLPPPAPPPTPPVSTVLGRDLVESKIESEDISAALGKEHRGLLSLYISDLENVGHGPWCPLEIGLKTMRVAGVDPFPQRCLD
jgi:hypothetical protein